MKLTESKLRRIIREEILNEANPLIKEASPKRVAQELTQKNVTLAEQKFERNGILMTFDDGSMMYFEVQNVRIT